MQSFLIIQAELVYKNSTAIKYLWIYEGDHLATPLTNKMEFLKQVNRLLLKDYKQQRVLFGTLCCLFKVSLQTRVFQLHSRLSHPQT